MTEAQKKKNRQAAAKLSKPKPVELPSGSWRCQVTVNGKRISIVDDDPVTAHAKAVATKEGLIEKKEKEERGSITLSEAIRGFIDSRDNILSPSTIRGYEVALKFRFKGLMGLKVKDITERDLQEAINTEYGLGKSVKTIKNGMGLVLTVLGEYKIINHKKIRYPQAEKEEHAYLNADQIVKLITAIEGEYAEIPILLGLWLGMRRSEILGLQWESIDFKNSKIRVDHSLVFDKDDNPVLKKQMKNVSSKRVLDCPAYILSKLDAYQPKTELRKGTVFKMHNNTIYQTLNRVSERIGIPFVGVHGLRHTNASVMLSLGIVDKIAMARGGWSTRDTMERIYQHVFSSDKDAADKTINNYFDSLISDKNEKTAHENAHEKISALEPQRK